ncbi:hypothetical protein B0H16DRAFT_1713830 [Mycena metata]|uniref:Uncharacterized protein n=1 Tax=Mycena metata TaxID=1033252 RepID=A0AAD7NTC2_9AGAR|nr:hypothetical protein B0H16DRAFT_1713830 [Mycena metata]
MDCQRGRTGFETKVLTRRAAMWKIESDMRVVLGTAVSSGGCTSPGEAIVLWLAALLTPTSPPPRASNISPISLSPSLAASLAHPIERFDLETGMYPDEDAEKKPRDEEYDVYAFRRTYVVGYRMSEAYAAYTFAVWTWMRRNRVLALSWLHELRRTALWEEQGGEKVDEVSYAADSGHRRRIASTLLSRGVYIFGAAEGGGADGRSGWRASRS